MQAKVGDVTAFSNHNCNSPPKTRLPPRPLIGADEAPAGVSIAELAAWVNVGRTLLNLDEFVTRE